jgi:hypothetical protein
MRRGIPIFLVSLALLGNDCTTSSSSLRDAFSFSASKVQELARDHQSSVRTMRCEGQISFESTELSQSGSFLLVVKKPDSVLITLQGPFGIKVGSALLTRRTFQFYNSLQNKLITGNSTLENLNRTLHIQLTFDDLLGIFSGGVFLEEDQREPDQRESENGLIVFKYKYPKASRSYWIDPDNWRIERIQHFDAKGKLEREEQFNDFDTVNDWTTPYSIRLTHIPSRRIVSLIYSRVQINSSPVNCTFSYPENAEHIRW